MMKHLFFAIAVIFTAVSCSASMEAQLIRQAQQERRLALLIENRTFDFIANQWQNTFMHGAPRSAPRGSGLVFLPERFYNSQFKQDGPPVFYPGNYTLVEDDNGWVITFSYLYKECREPLEVFGCEGEYLYRLAIDKEGKAVLEKSSSLTATNTRIPTRAI